LQPQGIYLIHNIPALTDIQGMGEEDICSHIMSIYLYFIYYLHIISLHFVWNIL